MQVLEIYKKWYSDIDKTTFKTIVRLDPTTVTNRKDIVKLGKYCRWLLQQYRLKKFNQLISYEEEVAKFEETGKLPDRIKSQIFDCLHVWHYWYRHRIKNNVKIEQHMYDRKFKHNSCNIFDYKLRDFCFNFQSNETIRNYFLYKKKKGQSKILYDDANIIIIEPLDFIACYHLSKGTDWCSKSENGYQMWAKRCMLIRVIDKKTQQRYRLTWAYDNKYDWSWATIKYPEFSHMDLSSEKVSPFDFNKFRTSKPEPNPENYKERFYTYEEAIRDWERDNQRFGEMFKMFEQLTPTMCQSIYDRFLHRQAERNRANKPKPEPEIDLSLMVQFQLNMVMPFFVH